MIKKEIILVFFLVAFSLAFSQNIRKDTLKKEKEIEAVNLKAPNVRFKRGKIILSPARNPIADSQNSWDFIKNSGYVEASETGSVKIRQKPTTIYINDRKIQLSGTELKNYLEAIPSNMIVHIEVIGTPDATSPADEMSIIKITLRNSDFQGLKLGIGSSVGFTKKMNMSENANINWKGKRTEIQAFISSNYKENLTNTSYTTEFRNNIWDVPQKMISLSQSNIYSLLFNYKSNKRHVISLYTEYSPSTLRNKLSSDNGSPTVERLAKNDSIFRYHSSNTNQGPNTTIQINYTLKNDSATSTLKVQMEYFNSDKKYNNAYQSFYFNSGNYMSSGEYIDKSVRRLNQYVGNINYTLNTKKWGDWSVGGRFSYNQMENPIDISKNSVPVTASSQDYKEKYYAFFLEGSKQFEKTYIRLGIRQESNFMNFIGGNSFDLKGWYPNILVQQNFSESFQMEASYKKSLVRPDYYLLNSLQRKSTENSVVTTSGNITLRPQIDHEVDISMYYKQQMLSLGMQYSPNYISTIVMRRGERLTQEYNNFRLMTLYASLSINKSFKDKYFIRNYFTINYLPIIEFGDVQKQRTTVAINNRIVGTIVLKKDYVIETSFAFTTNFYDSFYKHGGTSSLNLTLQKKIPNLNLTLYLTATDLLKGMKSYEEALYSITYNTRSYADARGVKLGLYWTFGNQKLKSTEKEDSLTEDTKNRNKK
ncbi:hypothetical protein C1637_03500 [Chryseobacterium lactis]|uniref:Outer membrane protein beta-barrel domain-containing protein n=1 Tax=Chryseobacterium lactis TaxID=1241981 RepID=A0A3G6RTN4_CHRLC|nr:outer membrane beta-barrel protein [Chryseobacterium lactis]AZA81651.1 hypothetical protein EG342_06895 [Chryseobacterium lactis]AZB06649.1 hypothetical protein EG341_23015 [Chryseobacterium lactis]PNW15500.1 hypothetical protein C1637_03500 [Chryseobacterium lactis]